MSKSLGAWFPNATVQKVPALEESCTLLLFYHYCKPPLSDLRKQSLTQFLQKKTASLGLGGRIRVANEGLNSTISGTHKSTREFADALTAWGGAADTSRPFSDCKQFKFVDDLPPDRAFKDAKIIPATELVFYGIDEKAAPLANGGVHLDPKAYHAKMNAAGTVIIDVRNHYEAAIGRFDGQEAAGGAKYIDPKMRKSTDFKAWLSKPETKAELKGKEVLMYCTGGVRCERASALLKAEMEGDVKGVFQLDGGIEKYLQEFPDGGHWKGKNFVFDKREAFGVGNLAGVGGVVESDKKNKKKKKVKEGKKGKKKGCEGSDDDADPSVLGKCCVCSSAWDRYIGKKKCYTCGVPVLMCTSCLCEKLDKTPGRELEVRCPLCKMENITVPAADVDLTENGVGVREVSKGGNAAPSVLKWGGGHASKKKEIRTSAVTTGDSKATGVKRKACNFGDGCTREGCWFSHPRDGGGDKNSSGGDDGGSGRGSGSGGSGGGNVKKAKKTTFVE